MGIPTRIALLLAALLLCLGLPVPAGAQGEAPALIYERYDVTVDLLPDGTFNVLERQQVNFRGLYRRGFRDVPLRQVDSITEVSVGEPGRAYRNGYSEPGTFGVTVSDNQLHIVWHFEPTTNRSRTFELSYRVRGGLRVYSEGDQLWWIAVPKDLPAEVRAATVLVRLPTEVPAQQLRAEAIKGSEPPVPPEAIFGREVRFSARDIAPGSGFDIRVQIPHGLVGAQTPSWQPAYDRQAAYDGGVRPIVDLLCLLLGLAVLAGGGALLFGTWYGRGRDPEVGRAPREVREPPSDLPPGVVGTLVDERVDQRDILATLLDLAGRGMIRITAVERSSDYTLTIEAPRSALQPYERSFIGALFHGERETSFARAGSRWQRGLPLFRTDLYKEAVRRELFSEDPEEVRARWRARGWMALAAGAIGLLIASTVIKPWSDLAPLPFGALVVVGLGLLFVSPRMPRRTRKGALEAAAWLAYARHLQSVDFQPSESTEAVDRRLAYAAALGVDRSWLRRFESAGAQRSETSGSEGPIILGGLPGGGWSTSGGEAAVLSGGPSSGGSAGTPGGSGAGGVAGPAAENPLSGLSHSLSDLLNAASQALSSGGGGGSSGGGDWGGSGGGGGWGGFSGGGGGGFDGGGGGGDGGGGGGGGD